MHMNLNARPFKKLYLKALPFALFVNVSFTQREHYDIMITHIMSCMVKDKRRKLIYKKLMALGFKKNHIKDSK